MKSVNIKKSSKKTKEEIEKNIIPTPQVEVPAVQSLVPEKFYTGGLSPILANYLPEGLELTEQEIISVNKGMAHVSTGLRAAVPLNCYGPKCPFRKECPFFKIEKAPLGKPCIVESMLMDLHSKRYIDEFEVNHMSMSEVATCQMLATTHVMEMRAFKILSVSDDENPDGFIKNVVGFNNDDEPIIQMQEHPAYEQIERAWRWRKNLLESMVGTRKEQYKRDALVGEKLAGASTGAADLKSKIDKLTIDISGD